jgi:uncharacterized protein involved in cysteine biosynthesis
MNAILSIIVSVFIISLLSGIVASFAERLIDSFLQATEPRWLRRLAAIMEWFSK